MVEPYFVKDLSGSQSARPHGNGLRACNNRLYSGHPDFFSAPWALLDAHPNGFGATRYSCVSPSRPTSNVMPVLVLENIGTGRNGGRACIAVPQEMRNSALPANAGAASLVSRTSSVLGCSVTRMTPASVCPARTYAQKNQSGSRRMFHIAPCGASRKATPTIAIVNDIVMMNRSRRIHPTITAKPPSNSAAQAANIPSLGV